ncbi:pyruvate carboxylase, putative, partial [Pediculus humanus corporis]
MPRVEGRPGSSMEPLDFENLKKSLESTYDNITERDVMSAALYPKVTEDYLTFRESFGPVDKLKTRIFLTGPKVGEEFEVSISKGKTISVKALAMNENLTKAGEREVFFEMNGQLRSVMVKDKEAVKEIHLHPKANKRNEKEIGAPMPGEVIDIKIKAGDVIEKGGALIVLSAMKMEM